MSNCKHKNRQGIASPSNWGKQVASVICLDCGKVLYSSFIDTNKVTEQEPIDAQAHKSVGDKNG